MLLSALTTASPRRAHSLSAVLPRSLAASMRRLSSAPPRAPRPSSSFNPPGSGSGLPPLPPLPSGRQWRGDSPFPPPSPPPSSSHAGGGGHGSLPPPSTPPSGPKRPSRWAPIIGGLLLAFGTDAVYCLWLYDRLSAADTAEEVARLEERTALSMFLMPWDNVFEEVLKRARTEREQRQAKKKKLAEEQQGK